MESLDESSKKKTCLFVRVLKTRKSFGELLHCRKGGILTRALKKGECFGDKLSNICFFYCKI